jgi:hypothetical protein
MTLSKPWAEQTTSVTLARDRDEASIWLTIVKAAS